MINKEAVTGYLNVWRDSARRWKSLAITDVCCAVFIGVQSCIHCLKHSCFTGGVLCVLALVLAYVSARAWYWYREARLMVADYEKLLRRYGDG